MKKIILVLLLVVVLSVFSFIYFRSIDKQKDISDFSIENKKQVVNQEESNLAQEKIIGNMMFHYPADSTLLVNEDTFVNLGTNFRYKGYNQYTGEKGYLDNTSIIFSLSKNINPQKQSLTEWFKSNTPENEPKSIYRALVKENLTINKYQVYKVRYENDYQLTGGFYDLITVYIPNGTDIYEISYYAVPLVEPEPDFALTDDDKKEISEYTKVVEQILQSIKFLE